MTFDVLFPEHAALEKLTEIVSAVMCDFVRVVLLYTQSNVQQ